MVANGAEGEPATYIPAPQANAEFFKVVHLWFSPSWIVRLRVPQAGIAADMQRAVQSVDPQLPFAKFRTLDAVRGEAIATERGQAVLLGALAALALLLAAVGIYGLIASSVTERTRELGIRMALGATPLRTVAAAAWPGIVLSAFGVAAGVVCARAAARVMTHLVWGVSVDDPLTFMLAAATVSAIAVAATLAPSLKILRVNPVSALRQL